MVLAGGAKYEQQQAAYHAAEFGRFFFNQFPLNSFFLMSIVLVFVLFMIAEVNAIGLQEVY